MSGKKSPYPDGRIPDRNPDGTPAVPWRSRWTEGVLPLWLVATAGGMAVLFVVGLFFYGSSRARPVFHQDCDREFDRRDREIFFRSSNNPQLKK
jgi:photosystem II PsbJ protein